VATAAPAGRSSSVWHLGALGEEQHVPYVVALQVSSEDQALGHRGIAGDVLDAVDGHVHLAALEHGVDLLDVQALAAELSQVTLPQIRLRGDGPS
jgi:hypothetical protein